MLCNCDTLLISILAKYRILFIFLQNSPLIFSIFSFSIFSVVFLIEMYDVDDIKTNQIFLILKNSLYIKVLIS